MNYLLDVNALIAGVYEDHEHYAVMRTWMLENKDHGLRVAPLVMTGCLRILMTVSGEKKMQKIISAIAAFREFYNIETVADDIENEQLGTWVSGPKQVTDAHLLAIAKRHELKLLTFDKNIPGKNVLRLG
ncbi:MAG: PIN domain-containing protein [Verrucomicrobia bacterium]|nr:PIN domain-containing protein [Verrucomicrobiota bacterium]MDA1066276.1 PIN domain-containing protein [Verrucomicrobiota bacterium]